MVNSGVLPELKVSNRTPSNRTRPAWVPNQMYPSLVCRTAWTEFWGNPSVDVQVPMPSWRNPSVGSRADAVPGRARITAMARRNR